MSSARKRALATAAVGAIMAGTVAWLFVVNWLEPKSSPQPAIEMHPALGVLPVPQAGIPPTPESVAPESAIGDRQASPTAPQDVIVTFPFKWLSPPDKAPDDGIPVRLRDNRGVLVEGEPCSVVGDKLFVSHELRDGRYHCVSREELHFTDSPYVWVVVNDGKYSLDSPFEVDGHPALAAHFLIPATLRLEVIGADSVELAISAGADGSPKDQYRFYSKFWCRAGSDTPVWVPRSKLRIRPVPPSSVSGQPPDRDVFELVSCSLGDRRPEREEIIHVVLAAYPQLTINLIEQSAGDLRRLLASPRIRLLEEMPELMDGPVDEWYFAARVRGLGGAHRGSYRTIAFDRVRTGELSTGGRVFTTKVLIPPVKEDRPISVEVSGYYKPPVKLKADSLQVHGLLGFPDISRFLAYGAATLRAGDLLPVVDVIVTAADWKVIVEVSDTSARPRSDLQFSVDAYSVGAAQSPSNVRRHRLPARRVFRTDQEGRIVLDSMPAVPGAELQVRPVGWQIPPELNAEFKERIQFHEGTKEETVRIVVPADFCQPLVLRFDSSGLTDGQRELVTPYETAATKILVPVHYLILPHQSNSGFESDMGSAGLDTDMRVLTRVSDRGRYIVIALSPFGAFGEIVEEVIHSGEPGTNGIIRFEPFTKISVHVGDANGEPVSGAIIFTSRLDPVIAWSLAALENSGHTSLFRPQTADADGSAQFACRNSRLDPRDWMVFHPAHGLFRPQDVAGSPDEGFVLKGVSKVATGDLILSLDAAFEREKGYEYLSTVTPIYSRSDPNRSDVLVGMGRTQNLTGSSALFQGLPPGRYMVAIIAKKGGAYSRPPAGTWNTEVDVVAGEVKSVQFPLR